MKTTLFLAITLILVMTSTFLTGCTSEHDVDLEFESEISQDKPYKTEIDEGLEGIIVNKGIPDLDKFSSLDDLQLQGSTTIFFKDETYIKDVLGIPKEITIEKEGYIRDPVGIFDLKKIYYPQLQINLVRELLPPHFEERGDYFRFKEVEIFEGGIIGPRGMEVGQSLEDVLNKFPAQYQDEENSRQYGMVEIENGNIKKIQFSDYVSDSPYDLPIHHFNFTIYFIDDLVEKYHIKHIMYDL